VRNGSSARYRLLVYLFEEISLPWKKGILSQAAELTALDRQHKGLNCLDSSLLGYLIKLENGGRFQQDTF
jgi:hypothetical protein